MKTALVTQIHWYSCNGNWLAVHAIEGETAEQAKQREYLDGSGTALTNLCVTKPLCMTPGEWENTIRHFAVLKESYTPSIPCEVSV
jgi:hypothetical protein